MAANKLTVDQRAAVLVRYGTGEKVHALAAEFGITDSAIRGLARTRGMPRRKNGRPPAVKHQTERSGTFKAGDSRASEAGRKGGSVKGPTKARDMKGKTRVKPKAMTGIKEGKDW